MKNILQEPLQEYLTAKKQVFKENEFARKMRSILPKKIEDIIEDKERYKIIGSAGKGQWTDCPWIAILDILITKTPQSGFYPVFIFKADMTGVYLSLNQGVTEVEENYKKDCKSVLKLRAQDFRAKFEYDKDLITEINLNSLSKIAKLYESGNIIAKYYPADNLPNNEELKKDVFTFLRYYNDIIENDTQIGIKENLTLIEQKKLRLHFRIERNTSIAKKVKTRKGYKCEACEFEYVSKYGKIGNEFIEAHHLTPISTLKLETFEVNIEKDFAVLCANCHRMIHKLDNPGDLQKLKEIIKTNS